MYKVINASGSPENDCKKQFKKSIPISVFNLDLSYRAEKVLRTP